MTPLITKDISNVKNVSDAITRKLLAGKLLLDADNSFIKLDYIIQNFKDGEVFNLIKEQRSSLTATNAKRVYVDATFKLTADTTKTEMGLYDYLIAIAKKGVNIFTVMESYIIENDLAGVYDIYE